MIGLYLFCSRANMNPSPDLSIIKITNHILETSLKCLSFIKKITVPNFSASRNPYARGFMLQLNSGVRLNSVLDGSKLLEQCHFHNYVLSNKAHAQVHTQKRTCIDL